MPSLDDKLAELLDKAVVAGQAIAPDALSAAQHTVRLYGVIDLVECWLCFGASTIGLLYLVKLWRKICKKDYTTEGEFLLVSAAILAAFIVWFIAFINLTSADDWVMAFDPNAYLIHRVISK